ncbi:MAG: DUF4846 domain-containing protein [Spirochaetota bacterium]|nr:DUF4846 domain-containing protein [Spirochaetota bacterium]
MKFIRIYLIIIIVFTCCSKSPPPKQSFKLSPDGTIKSLINPRGSTVKERILLPDGYERVGVNKNTFAYYLRTLPLKVHGSKVRYYNGLIKESKGVYIAVVDKHIGKKDLHQCADAIMLLRGEYFYKRKEYKKIHFNFLNDGKPRYYVNYADKSYSRKSFWKYMEYIFASANTRSLKKELKKVDFQDIKIGDVFIQSGVIGAIGHAIIVIDMAKHKITGNKIFLLAQSYMPAQETQILINPLNNNLNPWYSEKFNKILITPEWVFLKTDLRRFR